MEPVLPDIYFFNPTCEYAVANGRTSWQPNRLLQKMEEDLCTLPVYFATPGDVVLVRKMPPASFAENLAKIGLMAPRFVPVQFAVTDKNFISIQKNRLIPWGWSPSVHKLLEPLKATCSADFRHSQAAVWQPAFRYYYSRKFAADVLNALRPLLPEQFIIPHHLQPVACETADELESCIRQTGKAMVKEPWSSSGRGLQPITKQPVVTKVWEKLCGIIKEQGYAMVEPYLDKQLDMALEYEIINKKVHFRGISRFFTDSKGRYLGNCLNGWPSETAPRLVTFAESMVQEIAAPLAAVLENSPLTEWYEGILGVDTLIFYDEHGLLRINPCLEINLRMNMGILSLKLEKMIAGGRKGLFRTYYQKGKTWHSFCQEMTGMYPAVFEGSKLASGFFPLVPADEHSLFGAFLHV